MTNNETEFANQDENGIYNTLDVYDAIAFVDDQISVYTTELLDNQGDKAKMQFIGAKLDNFRNIKELLNELYERRKSGEEEERK